MPGFIRLIQDRIAPPTHPIWIGWSFIAGLAVAIPSGWLLAYLAALPFMLGLFFCLALGLITGATMFRFGSRANLPPAVVLWFMGGTVASIMLLLSLWVEYRALPASVQRVVRNSYFESFTQQRKATLTEGVRECASSYLATRYPPGGFLGYVRWAVHDGRLQCPRLVKPVGMRPDEIYKPANIEYRLPYKRGQWVFRVGLCLLLLNWSIISQLASLKSAMQKGAQEEPPVTESSDGDEHQPG